MRINSFLILLLLPTIVFSQGYVSISGKIVDKTTQEALKQFDTGKANKATDSDFMELLGLTK